MFAVEVFPIIIIITALSFMIGVFFLYGVITGVEVFKMNKQLRQRWRFTSWQTYVKFNLAYLLGLILVVAVGLILVL